jgi:hypothetical protein
MIVEGGEAWNTKADVSHVSSLSHKRDGEDVLVTVHAERAHSSHPPFHRWGIHIRPPQRQLPTCCFGDDLAKGGKRGKEGEGDETLTPCLPFSLACSTHQRVTHISRAPQNSVQLPLCARNFASQRPTTKQRKGKGKQQLPTSKSSAFFGGDVLRATQLRFHAARKEEEGS